MIAFFFFFFGYFSYKNGHLQDAHINFQGALMENVHIAFKFLPLF